MLVIEDGSNVSGANSYITADEYIEWADSRFGDDRSTSPDTDVAERHILRAMDYFEAQEFIGAKKESAQALQWPRVNVRIDGYSVSSSSIPNQVKACIFELAYAEEQGNSELSSVGRKVKRNKIGSIEVEYADSSSSTTINRSVPSAMRKLLSSGGNGFMVNRV